MVNIAFVRPKFNNQDVDVKELEAEYGNNIADAKVEYITPTLEVRADKIRERGLRILKEGVND